jgi:hypothetical protein
MSSRDLFSIIGWILSFAVYRRAPVVPGANSEERIVATSCWSS